MVIKRDDIVKTRELKTERVFVPEWDGEVIVRELSARERDDFEASLVETTKKGKTVVNTSNMRARLVVACVVDESGQPIFYPTDVELLGAQSAAAVDRVFEVARRLSGMTAEDIEDLEKN